MIKKYKSQWKLVHCTVHEYNWAYFLLQNQNEEYNMGLFKKTPLPFFTQFFLCFLNCKPYYIQYSVCILYVCSIGRKEMLQAHTPLHYDLNICKRHWVTFPNQCVRILYWGGFFCICITYRTLYNVILRIARNLLKTKRQNWVPSIL